MSDKWLLAQQQRLRTLGLYQSGLDGLMGPATQRAIELVIAAAEKAAGIKPPPYPALPGQYAWINTIGTLPLIVHEGLKLLGTVEVAGTGNSPIILGWAKELGIQTTYTADATAWCGLYVGICAARANKDIAPVGNILWARNWPKFGTAVEKSKAALGDVIVFPRGTGGHVAIVIAVDDQGFAHILGGNQDDAVNIMRKKLSEALAVRRPHYNVTPASVKQYRVASTGKISTNEA